MLYVTQPCRKLTVLGYESLPTQQQSKFTRGEFTGLGQALIVAMFQEETDLKNGNIGLNSKGQVIKIDGDRAFASLSDAVCEFSITPESIGRLLKPDFTTVYWLDTIYCGGKQPKSSIVDLELENSPHFRSEANQAMLKICLMSDKFIEHFVKAYISSEDSAEYIQLMMNRRDQLKTSALQNESFKEYLKTPQAYLDADSLLAQIKTMRANGAIQTILSPEQCYEEEQYIRAQMDILNPEKKALNELKMQNQELIGKILEHHEKSSDQPLLEYAQMMRIKMLGSEENFTALSEIKQ